MSQGDKERYAWLKANGICVSCGQEKADKGRTRCLQCRFRDIEYARSWQEKNAEKFKEYSKRYQKERYKNLKANGLCVNCGKPTDNGKTSCNICAYIANKKRTEVRHANGVMPRDMMGNGNYCYFCGKPVEHEGDKTCSICRKRNADKLVEARKKIDYSEHVFKKMEINSYQRRMKNGT